MINLVIAYTNVQKVQNSDMLYYPFIRLLSWERNGLHIKSSESSIDLVSSGSRID